MPVTGLVHHARCLEHYAGPGHPERPERLAALLERLRASGLADQLEEHLPAPADPAELESVHTGAYVESVARTCERGRARLDAGDTYVCDASYEAALLAAGGALEAVDRVQTGRWDNAFVAARPPGHHAERSRAMGFCLFNNVAVAAEHLRRAHGVERVAILDWDVHHGNGTQHTFEHDPDVLYVSLHQYPHYPGTGSAGERGLGAGAGATLNCPLPAGSGEREWMRALEDSALPALEAFDPGFVLISAGFDAHRDDPLSDVRLETDSYRRMTRAVLDVARRTCGGRLVALLEGGYDLEALAASAEAHLEELAG